jgi:hypothetical protein
VLSDSCVHDDESFPGGLTSPGRGPFWAEGKAERWWSWWHLLELAAVFAIGATVMNFLYAEAAVAGGVSGHDSWYHVKMAELLPEVGATEEFPWLQFVYFTKSGDEFVSHHWGFHLLMVPFVYAAKWVGGDALMGGRWAISTFFAASLTLFNLILMTQRVRCRWLWLGLYLLMPSQFFSRQAFVRAIAPSLMFMFVIIVLMFRRRYVWAGLAVAAYTHLYLGGVVFAPLLVVCYFVAGLLGPRGDRVSWRLAAFTLAGWLLGVLTYPYAGGVFEFLRLQIFGSGLTADIPVGREWKPYEKVWWLTQECAWVLIPMVAALCLRLRFGPRINAKELSALLMSVVFGGLMLKSRRFVEYWPPFGLLATGLVAAPVLYGAITGATERVRRAAWAWRYWLSAAAWVVSGGAIALAIWRGRGLQVNAVRDHWQIWVVLAAAYLLVPLCGCWRAEGRRIHGPAVGALAVLAVPLAGLVFGAALVGVLWLALGAPAADRVVLTVPWWSYVALAIVYLVASWWAVRGGVAAGDGRMIAAPVALATVAVGGVAFVSWLMIAAGPQMASLQRKLKPKFDLAEIRAAMDTLVEASEPGSVVFTDDWDIFPVYFYVNDYNHYIVGLDPKFTQHRRPVLWERYKIISRGKTPKSYEVPPEDRSDAPGGAAKVRVRLEDIRDHFGAEYVIVDRDHKAFRRKLDAVGTFCERIHPPQKAEGEAEATGKDKRRREDPPYAVYRVFSEEEQAAADEAAREARRQRRLEALETRPAGPVRRATSQSQGNRHKAIGSRQ